MRSRIFALIILLILIALPLFLYWYFFIKNTSGVHIILNADSPATIKLSGTFSNSWFPMLDRALFFEKKCQKTCEFSPIAPANYQISVDFGQNFEPIYENFSLENGKTIEKNYTPIRSIITKDIAIARPMSDDEKFFREREWREKISSDIVFLGRDQRGIEWILRKQNASVSLFYAENEKIILANTWNFFPKNFHFFYYYDTIFLQNPDGFWMAFSLLQKNFLEGNFPKNTIGVQFSGNNWQVITPEETLFLRKNSWQKNLRFTHFVDVGVWRLGFIAKNSTARLSVSNYSPEDAGILLAVNRETGEIREIQRNKTIEKMFLYQNLATIESSWQFYSFIFP